MAPATHTKENNEIRHEDPWISCQFLKDKLRYRERYHRSLPSSSSSTKEFVPDLTLIPDGPFLRKFLALLERLFEYDNGTDDGNDDALGSFQLVLLESAAEYMDYRNASPCLTVSNNSKDSDGHDNGNGNNNKKDNDKDVTWTNESTATNERNRVVKLWQQYTGGDSTGSNVSCLSTRSKTVVPFADLSYRDDNDYDMDEFGLLGYEDMSIEDRSRCALIRAGRWFRRHHSTVSKQTRHEKLVRVLILSEDEQVVSYLHNSHGVTNEHGDLLVMNCNDFVSLLQQKTVVSSPSSNDYWIRCQQKCQQEHDRRNAPPTIYHPDTLHLHPPNEHVPYLTDAQAQQGIEQKTLYRGRLQVTKQNPKEAYVSIVISGETGRTTIRYFLNDRNGHFNRALHDQFVIIQPLPPSFWDEPLGRKKLIHIQNDNDNDNDNNSDPTSPSKLVVPTARVVALCPNQPNQRTCVATFPPPGPFQRDDNAVLAIPMDIRLPRIRIKTRVGFDTLVQKRLLVEIDGWDLGSTYPRGRYLRVIGDVGDLETEISCLLIENGIDFPPFSDGALACLPSTVGGDHWKIPSEEVRNRRDLRDTHRVFSVDPPGCQDIDDAMHAKVLRNGDVEIGVHIADVTYFLRHDSALDKEAAVRSTTFYLVDRRFDMLPSLLSSDLCSLHGQTDRLAVSVIWTMSPDFKLVKHCWYGRTIIHNVQAMTYEQAHNILHNQDPDDPNAQPPPPLTAGAPVQRSHIQPLKHDLSLLTKLARTLKQHREEIGGAIDLSSGDRGSELKFVLDETGNPIRVVPKVEMEVHHTIAELMIFANKYVAEAIHERYPESSLLRVHMPVDDDKLQDLKELLKANGVTIDGHGSKAFANTLKLAKEIAKSDSSIDSLFQSLATRAMSEAQYICTGIREEGVELSHYGLGIDKYTHFTSPIRRYADVVVHRLLLASLEKRNFPIVGTVQSKSRVGNQNIGALPDSKAMSVLAGDGLKGRNGETNESFGDFDGDDLIDELIDGAEDFILNSPRRNQTDEMVEESTSVLDPYKSSQVGRICERLNHQNRMAKLSSWECQKLFLSLYFRTHKEIVSAVVIGLRQNGLLVYVPKFDMKGAVFLSDHHGNVQINPTLFGLSTLNGLPPSSGFAAVEGCKMFPDGECILYDNGEEVNSRVELRIPGASKNITFKRLDIVTVLLSCDISDAIARIPPPRLHLIALGKSKMSLQNSLETHGKVDSTFFEDRSQHGRHDSISKENKCEPATSNPLNKSIFEVLNSIDIVANLGNVPLRKDKVKKKSSKVSDRLQTIPGRFIYGGFKNSDTRSVTHEASAAVRGHGIPIESRAMQGDYDASRQIEREATARMQRLAAVKRNARKAKASRR